MKTGSKNAFFYDMKSHKKGLNPFIIKESVPLTWIDLRKFLIALNQSLSFCIYFFSTMVTLIFFVALNAQNAMPTIHTPHIKSEVLTLVISSFFKSGFSN